MPRHNKVNIEWLDKLEQLDGESDLVIVATTSRGRTAIINKLAKMGHRRFLIEKMVCQSEKEYEELLGELERQHVKGWVDCGRRYFPFYKQIFTLMKHENNLILNVTGGNHGLGCNAIHFLDLYWWLSGMPPKIELDGQHLTPTLIANRRGPDLIEFSGTIIAATSKGGFASISFHPENDAPILVNITSENYRIFVDESSDKAFISGKENNWQWENYAFETLYSSNLTKEIALSIFEEDTCNLPTLEESFLLHSELFRIFNKHIKLITGKNEDLCPIT
jgi:predicted dehydrogenase